MSSGKYGKQAKARLASATAVVEPVAPTITEKVIAVPEIPELNLEDFLEEPTAEPTTYEDLIAEKNRLLARLAAITKRGRDRLKFSPVRLADYTFVEGMRRQNEWTDSDDEYQAAKTENKEVVERLCAIDKSLFVARQVARQSFFAHAPEMRRQPNLLCISRSVRVTHADGDIGRHGERVVVGAYLGMPVDGHAYSNRFKAGCHVTAGCVGDGGTKNNQQGCEDAHDNDVSAGHYDLRFFTSPWMPK